MKTSELINTDSEFMVYTDISMEHGSELFVENQHIVKLFYRTYVNNLGKIAALKDGLPNCNTTCIISLLVLSMCLSAAVLSGQNVPNDGHRSLHH